MTENYSIAILGGDGIGTDDRETINVSRVKDGKVDASITGKGPSVN